MKTSELMDWIIKASEHEQFARSIMVHKDAPAWGVTFFSQQMAELLLKGLCAYHEIALIKTHDLLELASKLIEKNLDLESLQQELKFLNRYYVENRYPGDYPEVSWQEAEKALTAAEHIKEFVLSKIK